MWSKISSALKQRDGNDGDTDHSDAQSSSSHPPPDPFCKNATTYYTHPVPLSPPPGGHSRTASREEDAIWSLRTQLALQQEICAQFEIDLGARDELVEALTARLTTSEQENDKRKNVLRSWKKKAADLEKMCRHLEEEVDSSRRESLERSIMDEASGEALRQLHRQISQLERERKDVETERNVLAQTVKGAEVEITQLKKKVGTTDEFNGEAIRQLHNQISQLKQERRDFEVERDAFAQVAGKAEAEIVKLREELNATDEASNEALRLLQGQISQLEQEKTSLQAECDASAQARENADSEALKLQEELAAAEETNREALRRLHQQISHLEQDKNEVEVERDALSHAMEETSGTVSQLTQEKEEIITERDSFSLEISRLRTHIQQLQKDSAAKEVTIVQLNKQINQDKEDIDGLNIALESKQQELELIKRKYGPRNVLGPVPGRTNSAPSAAGKPAGNAPPRSSRTSLVAARSPPTSQRLPAALGRATNTGSMGAPRRASISSMESKPKFPNRRVSVTSVPSESEKENASTAVSLNNARRTIVPA